VHYVIVSPGKDGNLGTADDVYTTDSVQPTVGQPEVTVNEATATKSAQ
jgi:general secretion pathway protein G